MNQETKDILLSKTIWGAVVAIIGGATGLVADPALLVDDIVTLMGAVLAAYGRYTAKTMLTVKGHRHQ
jgi:hypothetical protein